MPCHDGRVTQSTVPREGRIVVLAGPGVFAPEQGAGIIGVRALAATGSLGVANTWGAKGVFGWDSPHHLGTCGLQARDFELLGWADADAIIATGVDDAETPRAQFALAPVFDVGPDELGALAGSVRASGAPLMNELYPRLAAVAQPGFVDDRVPLHPARAVADLGAALPPGGVATADPGIAGLWVARTFPTPAVEPGGPRRVVVPSTGTLGAAGRVAAEAARAGHPAIIVTTDPVPRETAAIYEELAAEHAPVVLVVWSEHGSLGRASEHRGLVEAALAVPGASVVEVPVALSLTGLLIDAAGPVVAWGGLA